MWKIVMHQSGGCDYTIGCGVAFIELASDTFEKSMEEAKEIFMDDDEQLSDIDIESAYLIQDNDNVLPLDEWRKEKEQNDKKKEEQLEEEKERALYEKLKKKFKGT